MSRPLIPLLALLLVPWPAWAAPPSMPRSRGDDPQITLSAAVVGRTLVVARATTAGSTVRWRSLDPHLAALPPELYQSGGKMALFIADQPGKYTLLAWTAIGGEPTDAAEVSVTVGDVPPFPPTPPVPPPVPPPADPLTAEFQALYNADAGADKRASLSALAELCRTVAAVTVDDPTIRTNANLLDKVKEAARTLSPNALAAVRDRIASFLDAELGTKKNDPVDRGRAKAAFTRIYRALAGVNP